MAAQKYDPAILQKFAAGLYSRASSIEATYLIGGLLLGAAAPFIFSPLWVSIALLLGGMNPAATAGLGAIVGGLVGFVAGRNKAFKRKCSPGPPDQRPAYGVCPPLTMMRSTGWTSLRLHGVRWKRRQEKVGGAG